MNGINCKNVLCSRWEIHAFFGAFPALHEDFIKILSFLHDESMHCKSPSKNYHHTHTQRETSMHILKVPQKSSKSSIRHHVNITPIAEIQFGLCQNLLLPIPSTFQSIFNDVIVLSQCCTWNLKHYSLHTNIATACIFCRNMTILKSHQWALTFTIFTRCNVWNGNNVHCSTTY